MRIISTFKDYYDALTTSSEPIYIRKTTESQILLPFKNMNWSRSTNHKRHRYWEYVIDATIIGFCGEVMVAFNRHHWCFDRDKIVQGSLVYENVDFNYSHRPGEDFHRVGFNPPMSFTNQFVGFFSHECPIWMITGSGHSHRQTEHTLIRNPQLRNFGMVKHIDVPQTFQRIEMYLSNLSFPNKPIPAVSDLDMIEAKGFDKYSFRKDKTKDKHG